MISNSLANYLVEMKSKIEPVEREWDTCKKYTNPYEYIHTPIPSMNTSVAKNRPISRSYFKMIEILHFYHLLFEKDADTHAQGNTENGAPITTFHLAEGPGGFIEAMVHKRQCPEDRYIGMSLSEKENDTSVPGWKKSAYFLQKHPNVIIETGVDKTGDLLSLANFDGCCEKYGGSMTLITGDGGFDFSVDFNNQEVYIARLLFAQVAFAIAMQKPGGSFVLKIFDCFMQHTVDILALLTSLYEKVHVTKPQTSRYANSEKYVVCKGFRGNSAEILPFLRNVFVEMLVDETAHIHRFLRTDTPLYFLSRIEEYNAIFGRQQIETMYYTLNMIENRQKNDKLDHVIRMNVTRCVNWCIKYGITYNIHVAALHT